MSKPPPTADELRKWHVFLQREAQFLQSRREQWAVTKAAQLLLIADYIREQRAALQMTTVGGKRLDEEPDLTPHLGRMHDV